MMPPSGTLGILAGGGELPLRLINACRESGRSFFVIAFKGYTPPKIVDGANGKVPHAWVRLGAAGRTIKILKRAGVKELVLAGPIRRPDRKSTRLNSSHTDIPRMPSSA